MATMNEILAEATDIAMLYAELQNNEATDEEQAEMLMTWFKNNQAAFADKVDGYIAIIREYQAMEKAAKEETKRLQDRAKSHARHVERLKDTLKYAMDTFGIDKTKTACNTVSIGDNPNVQYDVDIEQLPDLYKRVKEEANRTEIQKALKAGATIDGVTTKETTKTLRIR